jgi:DNA-binding NtrC family response regulator
MSQPSSLPRVLLADDDDDLRHTLGQLLSRAGYQVIEVKDGVQATHTLEETHVDVLVTDLLMPHKEGLETISEAKKSHPGLRIVAISGGGRVRPEGYLGMAKRFGADRTMQKPFTGEELVKVIAELIAQPRAAK